MNNILGIIWLTITYRAIMGEWPETSDPDFWEAIGDCFTGGKQ